MRTAHATATATPAVVPATDPRFVDLAAGCAAAAPALPALRAAVPSSAAPPARGPVNPLPGMVDLLGCIADESGRPLPGAFLELLRHVAACVVSPPPGGDGAGVAAPLPAEWVAYFKAARSVARRLDLGATLVCDHGRGGYVLLRDGAEVARAGRVAELGLLLAALDGKGPKKTGTRVKLRELLPGIASTLYTAETINSFVRAAVRAEVARRCAEFDAEAATLDAGALEMAEVA